ncbi:hypothetical protein E4U57_001903 [Claviceps arundinis]|uniref:DUF7582 domain-containing protein n=1 Tax=Claviceps arundinis TaxID=1623583 RepID=A0ABQ7P9G9_9HYPO|nr:hypothetical protein E4U57_001903 [Claviceps arundinis]
MGLKDRISSPLEAGPSLLNDHHLSPSLTPALEHASSRLAKKSLHLTLVVVRRDYQLPTTAASSPLLCLASTSISPSPSTSSSSLSRRSFASRPVTALKQLVRTGSCRHGPGTASDHARSHDMSCGSRWKRANSSTGAHGPQLRRPISSMAPLSPPPMTPYTASSMATMTTATTATTTDHPGPVTSRAPGFLLFHAPDLSPCDQKAQRAIFTRTARKFNLPLLTPAVSPLAYGLSSQLFTNSVIQHQVLFSSDGLTILALDRLYSLKAALASYARIKTPLRLEDAVDELRRYVLAGNGAHVVKSHLFRAYDWLNVGPGAVADLDSMYKRAYGGPDQVGAIAGIEPIAHSPAPPPPLRANDEFPEAESPCHDRQRYLSSSMNGLRICPEPDGYALAGYSDGDLELHPDQDFDCQHYSSPLMNEPRIRPETDGYLLAGYQDGDHELHPDQNHDRQHYLSPSMKEPRIRPEPDGYAFTDYQDEDPELHPDQIGLAITTYSDTSKPAPASRGPALRIQSDFQSASRPLVLRSKWGYEDDDDDERKHETSNGNGNGTNNASCHKHTAVEQQAHEMHRTTRFQTPAMGFVPWKSRSVSRLRGVGGASVTIPEETPCQPCQRPVTPNGYDDISPVTRGEWSFLMVDEPSAKGRTGIVGT